MVVTPETFGAGAELMDGPVCAMRAPLADRLVNFLPHPQPITMHLSRAVQRGAYASPSFEERSASLRSLIGIS